MLFRAKMSGIFTLDRCSRPHLVIDDAEDGDKPIAVFAPEGEEIVTGKMYWFGVRIKPSTVTHIGANSYRWADAVDLRDTAEIVELAEYTRPGPTSTLGDVFGDKLKALAAAQ